MHIQVQRQLTVALENYPGRLAAISSLVAQEGINIQGISLIDNIEQGVIRLIPSDPSTCKALLIKEGFHLIEADVLSVELTDNPGQLSRLSQTLAKAGINLEYTYGTTVRPGEKMHLIIKVSDINKACQVLSQLEE